MIREFLEKQQEGLIAKKIELDEDYELVLSKIKENEKFLDLLDEEDSTYFSDFTPRDMNQKNKSRIQELQQLLVQLNQDKIRIEHDAKEIHNKLLECQNALNEWQQLKDVSREKETIPDEQKNELRNITKYIIQDPRRAKLELDHFIDRY
jgi:type II secretory pathway component HofQ